MTMLHLLMEHTQIRGEIPVDLFSSHHLERLVLGNNQLDGNLDFGTRYGNQLGLIDLQNKSISNLLRKAGDNVEEGTSQKMLALSLEQLSVVLCLCCYVSVLELMLSIKREKQKEVLEQSRPFAPWDPKESSASIPNLKGARSFSFEELKQCTKNFFGRQWHCIWGLLTVFVNSMYWKFEKMVVLVFPLLIWTLQEVGITADATKEHPLALLAEQTKKLLKKNATMYMPILSQRHPQVTVVSASLLHKLYGMKLKPFVDGAKHLTEDVVSAFPATDNLEQYVMDLIMSACEEGTAEAFLRKLTMYKTERISGTLVLRWVNSQLSWLG